MHFFYQLVNSYTITLFSNWEVKPRKEKIQRSKISSNTTKKRLQNLNNNALSPLLCIQKSSILTYVPSNIPRRRTLFHHGSIGAHVENILQTLKFCFVREKLTIRFLSMIERFEKRKGEHCRCCPIRHCVAYHHWLPWIRVADYK